jgi:putative ABC transport system ATP-binding protein
MPPLVRLTAVSKIYDADREPVVALKGVSLAVDSGEFLALMGPSGCGKSTLLHIMGAMDRPTDGEAWIGETPIHSLPEDALTLVRREQVGFVFQFFHLLPTLTIEENVGLPLLLGNGGGVDERRVSRVLETVGLVHRRGARPNQLSGGELQRAAVARAVVHDPPLVVADEPTGNLDSANGQSVLELLRALAEGGTCIVMATHSDAAAAYAQRTVLLQDGHVIS